MTLKNYKVSIIEGDGIGPEVMGEARKVLTCAGDKYGFKIEWTKYPFGATHYLKTGELLPESALNEMEKGDALMLGAVGAPAVRPGILEHGILLKLRFHFDQYVNLRPGLSFPKVPTPVPLPEGARMDTVVVRENTEDLYMGIGAISDDKGNLEAPVEIERGMYRLTGEMKFKTSSGTPFAAQVSVNTRAGIERIARYSCKLAEKRGDEGITLVSKSNAVSPLYGFYEDVVKELMKKEFPKLKYGMENVDAICYHLVRNPNEYGVMLCPNLFGDIISDLQAGLAGGLGTAVGGNIGDKLSMFEPVHGSAPDIAGTGRSNPIAGILSGALMLKHVGEDKAAAAVEDAVTVYLGEADKKALPFEFGGEATYGQVGDAVCAKI
jgi:isocitrate/isopropylmalate dehydrogenase